MGDRVYRFHARRLLRNLLVTLPLVAMPLILWVGRSDAALVWTFVVVAALGVAGVVWSAVRFRLTLDDRGLRARGRLQQREVLWAEVAAVKVRRSRDRARAQFRELVLITDNRRLVISSLPLGNGHFDDLVHEVHARVPPHPPEPSTRTEGAG